jgi:hypothetical protein
MLKFPEGLYGGCIFPCSGFKSQARMYFSTRYNSEPQPEANLLMM